MSSTAPSTPENSAPKMALNRSFTLPSKLATSSRNTATAEIGATEDVETLYVNPNGKIIKFTTSANPSSGALPWTSITERTVADGPLEVYHVPGPVNFLHSGSLLHAISPRSQCWCVDGVSKFAMRVLPDTYYRIELAAESPEDLEKVEELKTVLRKVLSYERTACPFARGFTTDQPEEKVIRKKRKSHGPAKKWKLGRGNSWRPEDGGEPPEDDDSEESSETDEDRPKDRRLSKLSETPSRVQKPSRITPTGASVKDRIKGLTAASRSFTAPPEFDLRSGIPSQLPTAKVFEDSAEPEASSHAAARSEMSSGRRTFQAMLTDMPPSPPDSSGGLETVDRDPVTGDSEEFEDSTLITRADDDTTEATADTLQPELQKERLDNEDVPDTKTSEMEESQTLDALETFSISQHDDHPQTDSHLQTDTHPQTETKAQADAVPLTDTLPQIGIQTQVDVVLPTDTQPQIDISPDINVDAQTGTDATIEEAILSAVSSENRTNANPPSLAEQSPEAVESAPPRPASRDSNSDPFAQIQARIQARRSIGGTISFHPTVRSPTRQSTSSAASMSSNSTSSSLSRRANHTQQHALASALVKKACAVFLGPPAHLVAIMLRIAARFANGTFGEVFSWASPTRGAKKVPGSFHLDGSDVEDFELEFEEDDFGVPLRSPIRLAARGTGRATARPSPGLRTRSGWELD